MAKRSCSWCPDSSDSRRSGRSITSRTSRTALRRGLRRRRIDARIVRCDTQPTASIVRRADRLRRQVIDHGGLKAQELHFVGHSTGGLDVRMLLTPGVKIARGNSAERIAERTRTAISVATPHHGTPLANHFNTVQGQTLLLIASALATSGRDAGRLSARLRRSPWSRNSTTGWAARTRRSIALPRAAAEDPLQPPRPDLEVPQGNRDGPGRGAATHARGNEPLRRGRGRPCRHRLWLRGRRRTEATGAVQGTRPGGPGAHGASGAVQVAARADVAAASALPVPEDRRGRRSSGSIAASGFKADANTSDGVVPTLSQLHGRVLHVACADHLDVVGHYTLAAKGTGDWLPSGAGFTPEAFESLWDDVAAAIARRRQPARAG